MPKKQSLADKAENEASREFQLSSLVERDTDFAMSFFVEYG